MHVLDKFIASLNICRLLSLARANYRPYGIDFPQGATGRFTNGRTYVDALGTFVCIYIFPPTDSLKKTYLLLLKLLLHLSCFL